MKNANKLYCQLYSTYVKVYNSESYEGVTDRYKKKKRMKECQISGLILIDKFLK